MTGSVLMELAFADRLDTDLERVTILDRAPIGDPLLDRVLERIAHDVQTNDTKAWIETLSVEETAAIQEHALASLTQRGILRREEKRLFQETVKHLWVFRPPRHRPGLSRRCLPYPAGPSSRKENRKASRLVSSNSAGWI